MQSHHAQMLMQLQVTLQTLPPVSGANDKNTTQDGHKTSRSGQWTRRPEQVVRTTGDEVCCGDGGTAGGGAAGMFK